MQIRLRGIPYTATKHDVKRAIAEVLHGEDFSDGQDPEARQINFKVVLDMDDTRDARNKGTGTLTLPQLRSFNLDHRFWRWLRDNPGQIRVQGRSIRFYRSDSVPRRTEVDYLSKSRYIAPEHEEAREKKIDALKEYIRIDQVQFGVLFYPPGPGVQDLAFSIEWEYSRQCQPQPWFMVDYNQKTIRIELGDHVYTCGDPVSCILINFADIEKIGIGYDGGNPFACFALTVRPTFEKPYDASQLEYYEHDEVFPDDVDMISEVDYEYSDTTYYPNSQEDECTNSYQSAYAIDGRDHEEDSVSDEDDFGDSNPGVALDESFPIVEYRRQRITELDAGHGRVIPFTSHLRLIFPSDQEWRRFTQQCRVAGLPTFQAKLEAFRKAFFTPPNLRKTYVWMRRFHNNWPLAFQLAALLHNGHLNTEELDSLRPDIEALSQASPHDAGDILKYFRMALCSPNRNITRNRKQCLARVVDERRTKFAQRSSDQGVFSCFHVTFTPTRMILEGPTKVQSNSVIREYWEYRDHFIRVDFLDENQSQLRFDREVDGPSFLQSHVGSILKGGFKVAGREFQLLGYSNSSLDSHVFWFVHPFDYRSQRQGVATEPMTAERIRASLGDFSEIVLPAKYAARIGQAFTSTSCSISLSLDEWEEIDEILEEREDPKSHTDGVGRISEELADEIWNTYCTKYPDRGIYGVKPSAYQIRFLGYKGMVAVDRQLQGRKMCLRPEMRKFKPLRCASCQEKVYCFHLNGPPQVHIADVFDGPKQAYLTRDLVTILEDRDVRPAVFRHLQEKAKTNIYLSRDSSTQFIEVLRTHHMAFLFRLPLLLQQLSDLGIDYGNQFKRAPASNDEFICRVREYAIQQVLRDMKNRARIPVPNSHLLVGVADEGPAYVKSGCNNVYHLKENQIYACVQSAPDSEPQWLKGLCFITRSPTVHPGDVQRVTAIGKPKVPDGQICLFEHMKNVVVLPTVGARSLASCLGGGDLDGDLYYVFQYSQLLPTLGIDPAAYPDKKPPGRPFDFNDVCDFIVEYMHSDVLGIISVRRLIIADQSKYGCHDPRCFRLAELCSDAVDYPKSGRAVDMKKAPGKLMPYNPDWYADEDSLNDPLADSYRSDRTLGILYRGIKLDKLDASFRVPAASPPISASPQPLKDTISTKLTPLVEAQLGSHQLTDVNYQEIVPLLRVYLAELRCICFTYSMSPKPGSFIPEEEIVLGVILSATSERRIKKDRTYRMREDVGELVHQVRRKLLPSDDLTPSDETLRESLLIAWTAWGLSMQNTDLYGANSFGLIALGVVFDVLHKLGAFPKGDSVQQV